MLIDDIKDLLSIIEEDYANQKRPNLDLGSYLDNGIFILEEIIHNETRKFWN